MAKKNVGVVGLGIMGGAFARNLIAAGWRVVGHDIDRKRQRVLARAGVDLVENAGAVAGAGFAIGGKAGEVGGAAPSVITSLPHPAALAETAEAIIAGAQRPRVVVE